MSFEAIFDTHYGHPMIARKGYQQMTLGGRVNSHKCMLGNFACFFVGLLFIFQHQLFKNYFRITISVVSIQIRLVYRLATGLDI